ncbi:MAG TPA: glycosyltransferase family 8 protein [Paracoccus sp.]|nr:glycosyltransferase family 8 protein [Paracoccus sp. (in: a-proteobacteria)]
MTRAFQTLRGQATHRQAIYLCCDARFLPYALFLIDQIATKTPTRDFDLVLMSSSVLPHHPLLDTHDVRVVQIDLGQLEAELPVNARISLASYLRIFGPGIFAADYDRMLYLDADIFYQRGDLSKLLRRDMKGFAIAAVRDMPQMRKPKRLPGDFKVMGLSQAKYFNAGMMLIDVAQWHEQQIEARALELAARVGDKLAYHDQSALNGTVQGKWLEMSPVWNFTYSHQSMFFSSMFDVCFYHFVGRRKPFMGSYGGFPLRFTEPYRRFMTDHFPDELLHLHDGLQIERKWHLLVFALILHALFARRYLRFEGYFRSDWDTR